MYKKSSALKFVLKNKTLLKHIASKFKHVDDFSNAKSESKSVAYLFNYKFDAEKPKTFNEYLVWIKHNYRNDEWEKAADKLLSKEIIKELGLEKYLPKVYGVYKNSSEINLDKLPDKFVLKTNHDCGSVFVCEKNKTDFSKVFNLLDKSLLRKYNKNNNEWVYENIEPLIFAEELLYQNGGGELVDYKLCTYNGKYKWGFSCCNRSVDSRFVVFEGDYEMQNVDFIYLRPKKNNYPRRPQNFSKMIELAEIIGRKFSFVRVDFFDTTDGIKIGELTFFTQSGHGPFTRKEYDEKYGSFFDDTIFYNLSHKTI